eukprot:COSAG05_NODE_533_length_8896_cov_17.527404_7_plen_331_part_00
MWLAIGCAGVMGMGMGYAFGTIAKQWLALAPARAELQKLIDLAAQGDSEAAHALGIRYSTAGLGDVVRQDIATAMAYYQQAADAGHIGAHCRLGAAYRSGLAAAAVPAPDSNPAAVAPSGGQIDNGVDMARAQHHFEIAAAAGHAEAQFNLAVILERGEAHDTKKVLAQYQASARSGFAPAQFQLGLCHYHGRLGLTPDQRAATELWAAASEGGDDRASFNLAMLHLRQRDEISSSSSSGDSGGSDAATGCDTQQQQQHLDAAKALLQRAARQGNSRAPAQLQLLVAGAGAGLSVSPLGSAGPSSGGGGGGGGGGEVKPVECEFGVNDVH